MNRFEMELNDIIKASAVLQGFDSPQTFRKGANNMKQAEQASVDLRAIKFNQATIVAVSSLSILLGSPVLLVPLAAVLFAGTFNPKLALFKRLFSEVLRPGLNLPKAEVLDDPRAHNFAARHGRRNYLAGLPKLLGKRTVTCHRNSWNEYRAMPLKHHHELLRGLPDVLSLSPFALALKPLRKEKL